MERVNTNGKFWLIVDVMFARDKLDTDTTKQICGTWLKQSKYRMKKR